MAHFQLVKEDLSVKAESQARTLPRDPISRFLVELRTHGLFFQTFKDFALPSFTGLLRCK